MSMNWPSQEGRPRQKALPTWNIQEPSSSLMGKRSRPGKESGGQAVKGLDCYPCGGRKG